MFVQEIVGIYKERRDALCSEPHRLEGGVPKGPCCLGQVETFRQMKSVEFCKMLIREAKVAVSPGLGFGEYGDEYVRFALVENSHRINQAIRGMRQVIQGKKA
jgi:alanine-synthesizing transaminase